MAVFKCPYENCQHVCIKDGTDYKANQCLLSKINPSIDSFLVQCPSCKRNVLHCILCFKNVAVDCEKMKIELAHRNRTPVTLMRAHMISHVKTRKNEKRKQEEMMDVSTPIDRDSKEVAESRGCVSSHVDDDDCKSIDDEYSVASDTYCFDDEMRLQSEAIANHIYDVEYEMANKYVRDLE